MFAYNTVLNRNIYNVAKRFPKTSLMVIKRSHLSVNNVRP